MTIAILGGSGLTNFKALAVEHKEMIRTPYGEPSAPLIKGSFAGRSVVFLARHGIGHTIPPHQVNYRANLWALKNADVEKVIAVAAVGGISSDLSVPSLMLPDQILDYTHSRQHTFFDGRTEAVTHVDFSFPYCNEMRSTFLEAGSKINLSIARGGTYAATQGPRLETAAEIDKYERDGADVVGMTGMPEAALARELELRYVTIAVVTNPAAGRGDGEIEIKTLYENLQAGISQVMDLLASALPKL